MFDSKLPISYYKEIAVLNREHEVFVVQHRESNKIFVKKILSAYSLAVYEQLFKKPVPGIPRIYAMYEEARKLTVIEEYISGDTLQEILGICGRLSMEDTASCAIGLCDILAVLHALDPPIVHRDIKPSNVILTEDGRTVLLDLNAAKHADPGKARDTRLLGTDGFAAPEQYGFGSSTPLTDIYALGQLMRTLLCGEPAAPAGGDLSGCGKLFPVIRQCLQMDPDARFKSVLQLKEALLEVLRKS